METNQKVIAFKQKNDIYFVKQSEIIYCKAHEGKTTIITSYGATFNISTRIIQLITKLDNEQFFVCNPTSIININYVAKIIKRGVNSYDLILKDSTHFTMSRSRRRAIIKIMGGTLVNFKPKSLVHTKKTKINNDTQSPIEEQQFKKEEEPLQ